MSSPTEVAGRYQLGRRLGAGGMSTVFLALDKVLEREVAVKLLAEHLADDEAFVTRFRHEALAAARLQHPNIVQVYDSGQDADSGRHFIVMEYVEGPSAADLLREHGQLEVEQAVRIASEACHGLDYAHRQGVVHRDVKPGNLLIVGETGALKLADFGIAKATEQTRITQAGSVLGTAAYLSPEQAQGHEAGPQSDVYSLGVCTYQFLTGRLPHEYGSLTELAMKQQNESAQPIVGLRPEVPAELDRAVRLCLEPDLDVRYGSALELAAALDAGVRGEDTEATIALAGAPQRAWSEDDDTESTRALPPSRPAGAPARRQRQGPPPPPPPRRARDPRAERRQDRARRLGTFLILIAVALLAAIVVVLLTQTGGDGFDRIVEESVRDQVTELKELIRQNSE